MIRYWGQVRTPETYTINSDTVTPPGSACHVEATLRVIGGRWKPMVLHYLLRETLRFNRLQRLLGGVTHRTLARQLRELEADGIVSRKIYPVIPPRVEYSLTKEGRSLKPVLESMHAWGRRWSAGRRG